MFGEPEPVGVDARAAFLLAHRIAVWDVLASCDIEGASDASIAGGVPNDLRVVADVAPLEAVFTTGAKAADLYRRLCVAQLPDVPHVALPSTSAANARMRLSDLVAAYVSLKEAVEKS